MRAGFAQKLVSDRKQAMQAIARLTCTQTIYTRAPRFGYEADGWSIDHDGVLSSPVFQIRAAEFHANIIGELGKQGFASRGGLSVTVCPVPFDPAGPGNIGALLSGKSTLIRHALSVDAGPSVRFADCAALEGHGLFSGFVYTPSSRRPWPVRPS